MTEGSVKITANLDAFLRPDNMVGPSRYSFQKFLRETLPSVCRDGDRVLDFGAGNGNNRFFFSGMELIGFDISHERIAEITDHSGYFVGDGTRVPLKDGSVDFLFCNWVLEYIPDPGKALTEMYRVIRPGGRVYLGVPTQLERIVNEGGAFPLRILRGQKNLMAPDGEEIFFSAKELTRTMRENGFRKVIVCQTAGLFISLMKVAMIYIHFSRLALIKIFLEKPMSLLGQMLSSRSDDGKFKGLLSKLKGTMYPTVDTSRQKVEAEYRQYLAGIRKRSKGLSGTLYVIAMKAADTIDGLFPAFAFEIAVLAEKPDEE